MSVCQYYKCDNPSCKIDGCRLLPLDALPIFDIEEPYDPPIFPQKQISEDDVRRIIKEELKIFAETLKKDHDGFWK